eukprot:TRINITY_DN5168_c2_g2_i1.p1 TRINITY_DN5168_c2_g2~~TRINITY_DN5168_c2_g2_i1.p1  ORF type:complete len:427 (+),score=89.48 TRINITY_DN5168_c2_g2_i1:54-1334(+)
MQHDDWVGKVKDHESFIRVVPPTSLSFFIKEVKQIPATNSDEGKTDPTTEIIEKTNEVPLIENYDILKPRNIKIELNVPLMALRMRDKDKVFFTFQFKDQNDCLRFKIFYEEILKKKVVYTIISVDSFEVINFNHQDFAIFHVGFKTNLSRYNTKSLCEHEGTKLYNWKVPHRYSDFKSFDERCKMNYPNVTPPALPPKSSAAWYNTDFLEERKGILNNYLVDWVKLCPDIVNKEFFIQFITIDRYPNAVVVNKKPSLLDNKYIAFVEKTGVSWASKTFSMITKGSQEAVAPILAQNTTTPTTTTTTTASPTSNSTEETINHKVNGEAHVKEKEIKKDQVLEDLSTLSKWLKDYNVVPDQSKFDKYSIFIIGTTSAGKSSYVNHFFGIGVKASSVSQVDTIFSIIEVVDRESFCLKTSRKKDKNGN